jgi:hypothetical protein
MQASWRSVRLGRARPQGASDGSRHPPHFAGRSGASPVRECKHRKTARAPAMDYLYSLYDALISINVPGDKARAVVDAMERDMASTIATKTDLQLLRQELLTGMAGLATRSELAEVKADMAGLKQELLLVRKDLELLSSQLTVRLGAMLAVGLGLLFGALRFG